MPLVALIGERSKDVKEQALLTFGKLLFAPGNAGPENITYFFQAEGEKPLLECMLSEHEEVQVPALSIIQGTRITPSWRGVTSAGLTATAENREYLKDAKLEEKLLHLENHPNVKKQGSQARFLCPLSTWYSRGSLGGQLPSPH